MHSPKEQRPRLPYPASLDDVANRFLRQLFVEEAGDMPAEDENALMILAGNELHGLVRALQQATSCVLYDFRGE